jgi:dephospho-CoA kinase
MNMLVVGLTGGIGAGKSMVAQFFAELGALVIDADQLARMVIERGSEGFAEVLLRFGEDVITNGDVDRKKLADVIFQDESARKDLEAIIHPRVQALFSEAVEDLDEGDILIYEIPLLVETGAAEKFDYVITVESELELRKERLLKRGLYISQIEKRIAAQASPESRAAVADWVLHNNSDEDSLLRQVENLWESVLLPQSLG